MKKFNHDDDETRFQPGDSVWIDGLKSAAQHNGKLAKVRRWIPERGRWALQLPEGEELAVRPGTLELVERASTTAASSAASADRQQLALDEQLLNAVSAGSLDEVVRLLEHGVPIDASDEGGWTAAISNISNNNPPLFSPI